MLVGHVVPDEASSHAVHLLHDARLFLQLEFAPMPRRACFIRYRAHDVSPGQNLHNDAHGAP
ncbi:hypothetical protein P355_1140 [Burkholderia cenocepacia KC-01]|nr:hypothetical protein P355_1140 [Burkholderia cenocepacia KC-01]